VLSNLSLEISKISFGGRTSIRGRFLWDLRWKKSAPGRVSVPLLRSSLTLW